MRNKPITFFKSRFVKNSLTLITGTSFSQLIPIVSYPFLTRLYTPESFGNFTIFMSLIPLIVIISSGGYEQAILVSSCQNETYNLIQLIIRRSVIFITSIIIISTIFLKLDLFQNNEIFNISFILELGVVSFLTILYNIFNEWCILRKKFKNLSANKIYNSSTVTLIKLFANKISYQGLILGELAGKLITILLATVVFLKNESIKSLRSLSGKSKKALKIKFKDFPRLMTPDLLINNLNGSLHVFFITIYFSKTDLGYLSLSLSMLTLPVTVVSGAIKDVFRQQANEDFIKTGSCKRLYKTLIIPISIISAIGFSGLYFVLPEVFPLMFGEHWAKSGEYVQILLPLFYFNFVSMSLGGVFVITNQLKISLMWQLYGLFSSAIALFIGSVYLKDFESTLILYVIAKSTTYILHSMLSFKYSEA